MIDINLRFQAVLFGSWEEVKPKPENIIFFTQEFTDKELIPTTFQEFGPKGIQERLILRSSDGIWNVEFGTDRIDIHKNNANLNSSIGNLKSFIDDITKISNVILDKYPKKLNRLALVTQYLLKEMSEEEMKLIFNKLVNTIDLYKSNDIAEWNNRVVSKIKSQVRDKDEFFNVISEVKKITANIKLKEIEKNINRIELKFDINTFHGNSDYRFDKEDISSFLNEAAIYDKKLTESYLSLMIEK